MPVATQNEGGGVTAVQRKGGCVRVRPAAVGDAGGQPGVRRHGRSRLLRARRECGREAESRHGLAAGELDTAAGGG